MAYTALISLFVLSAVAAAAALFIAIYSCRAPKSMHYAYLAMSIFVLTIGRLFEFTASTFDTAVLAGKVRYFGQPFITPFLFLFVCEYCGIILKKRWIASVFLIPTISTAMVVTWPLHNWYYKSLVFTTDSLIPHLINSGTGLYYVTMAWYVIIAIAAGAVLITHWRAKDVLFRKQATVILIATFMPVTTTVFNIIDLTEFDLTPIFLSATSLLMAYSNLKLGLYSVGPAAREQIIEAMNDGFIIMDTQGQFIDANQAAKRLIPLLSTISIGAKISDISEIAWISEDPAVRDNDYFVIDENGKEKHYRLSETEVVYFNNPIGRCIMLFDNTETRMMLEEMSHLAEIDALTGLINRRTLFNNGERLLSRIAANNSSACALMMDLDFFKTVNDTYGHIKGDEVLKRVAETLSVCFRSTDLIARYGGEEFCAFLPDITEQAALNSARRVREQVNAIEFSTGEQTFSISISTGVTVFDPLRHLTLEAFLADADAALYTSKNSGRDTIYISRVDPALPEGNLSFDCAI